MLISGILTSGSIIWMLGKSIIPWYAVRTCRMRCTSKKLFNLTLVGYLLKSFPLFSCLRYWWVLFHDWTSIYTTSRQTGKVIRYSQWDILGCKLYSASTIKYNDKSGNKSRLTLIWRDAVACSVKMYVLNFSYVSTRTSSSTNQFKFLICSLLKRVLIWLNLNIFRVRLL